ncbi:hypothetical protein [Desulfovibrio gilichinskyi]|nr:hypothetical protein [Desulfovibrio gilichinskyi]
MKELIKKIPVINSVARFVYYFFTVKLKSFSGSQSYWEKRYSCGGTSGAGSYDKLARFKAEFLNDFVRENNIETVIEYGCGDGNQLKLGQYPLYTGFDVSQKAISLCQFFFPNDETKVFKLVSEYSGEKAELTMSLDVIYHLIEDSVYADYMNRLFESSSKYVTIYSSNRNEQDQYQAPHVKHRMFSKWVEQNKPEWKLKLHIPNKYPLDSKNETGSCADFYVYEKSSIC